MDRDAWSKKSGKHLAVFSSREASENPSASSESKIGRFEHACELPFDEVFPVMQSNGYFGFETVKNARLVCRSWNEAIMKHFQEAKVYSANYRHAGINESSVVVWLPLRDIDAARLLQMNAHPRCPAFGETLILKFPYRKMGDSMNARQTEETLNQLTDVLATFTRLEIVQDLKFTEELFEEVKGFETWEAFRLGMSVGVWDEDVILENPRAWILPFIEKMTKLESIMELYCCLAPLALPLSRIAHLRNLKAIHSSCDCLCNWNPLLIQKCAENLELMAMDSWGMSKRSLASFTFPKLKELKVCDRRWDTTAFDAELIEELVKPNALPELQILTVVLTRNFTEHNLIGIKNALKLRRKAVKLFIGREFVNDMCYEISLA